MNLKSTFSFSTEVGKVSNGRYLRAAIVKWVAHLVHLGEIFYCGIIKCGKR